MELTAPKLRALRDRLVPAFAPVDDDLLAVGDRLGHAAGRIDALGDRFGDLRQLLDGEALETATTQLDLAAARMATLATRAEAENAALAELGTRLRGVGARIAFLSRINEALGVLTLNSAIASSGLDTDSRDIATFQTELRRLTDLAAQTVRRFGQLHAAAMKDLALVAAQQAAFTRNHGAGLRNVSVRILAGLNAITALRREASATAVQTQERGRAISGAIGTVVTALQVGDATRQRLEHVADALGQLLAGLDGAERPWCSGLDPALRDALAARAIALQAALLRDAGGTLAAEMRSIHASLSRLGVEVRGMVDQGQARSAGWAGWPSFLGALDGDLGEAATLVGSSQSSRQALDAAMAAIDGHMRSLRAGLADIRGMEIDLRVAGLNAVFRCARLGKQGAALGAVTIELRAYAKQMAEGVDGLAESLEAALETGATLMTAGGDGQAAALDDMMAAMRNGLSSLGHAGKAMDSAIDGLRQDGGRVPGELAAMAECLGAGLALADGMAAMGQELELLSAAVPPPPPPLLRDRLLLVHAVPFTIEGKGRSPAASARMCRRPPRPRWNWTTSCSDCRSPGRRSPGRSGQQRGRARHHDHQARQARHQAEGRPFRHQPGDSQHQRRLHQGEAGEVGQDRRGLGPDHRLREGLPMGQARHGQQRGPGAGGGLGPRQQGDADGDDGQGHQHLRPRQRQPHPGRGDAGQRRQHEDDHPHRAPARQPGHQGQAEQEGQMVQPDHGMAEAGEQPLHRRGRHGAAHGVMSGGGAGGQGQGGDWQQQALHGGRFSGVLHAACFRRRASGGEGGAALAPGGGAFEGMAGA